MSLALVKANEEGCCLVCFEVFDLSISESRTPETSRFATTIANCGMKMGAYHGGLVIGLPRSLRGHDTIWVVVDHLTKFTHFLLIRLSNSVEDLGVIYVRKIVRLHGVPVSIISFGRGCNPLLVRI